MPHDTLTFSGSLLIQLRGPDGALKDERRVKNLMTTVGKGLAASRLGSSAAASVGWMGVGTGATAAAVGDTTLQAESARVALSVNTNASNVDTFTANFPAGTATGALTEAGLFNAAAAGSLSNRAVFAAVNKGAADSVSIVWTVTAN